MGHNVERVCPDLSERRRDISDFTSSPMLATDKRELYSLHKNIMKEDSKA